VITTASATLPDGYSLSFAFDHAALVASSRARADGADVRIARWDGGAWQELDRTLDAGSGWNTAATTLWFATSASIGGGSTDESHYLFYGNAGANAPPESLDRIFLFWDDFEGQVLSKWSADPDFSLVTEQAHGGAKSVKAAVTTKTNHRLIASGVAESDVALEAWWYLTTNWGIDLAQGVRAANPGGWQGYELSIDDDATLSLSKYVAGAFSAVYTQSTAMPPPVGAWARVTTRVIGDRMQALINGAQVAPTTGWTEMLGGATMGSIWLRSFTIPSGHAWFIDDVRLRRLVDPEPGLALGSEQPQG
jgi:hypothetical protein